MYEWISNVASLVDYEEWHPPSEAELKVIEARREHQDKISKLMGHYLLKGYKMLGSTCPVCEVRLQKWQNNYFVFSFSYVLNFDLSVKFLEFLVVLLCLNFYELWIICFHGSCTFLCTFMSLAYWFLEEKFPGTEEKNMRKLENMYLLISYCSRCSRN